MFPKRIIVCLDVKDGRVVKGVQFRNLRDMGDPVELAVRYEAAGADEIVFLDISASTEERSTLLDTVRRTAQRLFIPLTVGGGIRRLEDVERALRAGADKVSVNSAAVQRPELLGEAAARFGRQCVVASIDAQRAGDGYRVYTRGGSAGTALDAVDWARQCEQLGAGEILLTSIDRDGGRAGYDIELTSRVSTQARVPVIASGGAGSAEHVRDALDAGGADAALVAGMFHDGSETIGRVKQFLQQAGIAVRPHMEAIR